MARSRRSSESEPRSRDAFSPAPASAYDRRGSAPEPRAYSHGSHSRRPAAQRDDSYYDPRDKYYLSGDEGREYGYRATPSSTRDRESARRPAPPSRHSSSDRYRDSGRRSSSGFSSSHSQSSSRASRSGTGGGRAHDGDRERYYPPSSSRHSDTRAGKRPGVSRTNSSPRKSVSSAKQNKKDDGILSSAVRCALEAGAMAALKQRNDPSPWIGMKGTKVAAAAIGAAAIDTFMDRKAPNRKGTMSHTMMRQATTMALGNLVLGPAAKGTVMGRTR